MYCYNEHINSTNTHTHKPSTISSFYLTTNKTKNNIYISCVTYTKFIIVESVYTYFYSFYFYW